MDPIDLTTARRLIDFSGGDESLRSLAELQIEGAVALQNMIANPEIGFAYLADEVGMGKTYVALGVVAMMRYFNPMLRVLYICPSRNVREKWNREYKNFIRSNVRVFHGRIRTLQGFSATPYTNCQNVSDLLRVATSGYYADFFIGKDSFSMALSEDEQEWKQKLDQLRNLIPAYKWEGVVDSKHTVKNQFAHALNYILPTFDLVVIDEAHNFKHDFYSSDRNRVLSGVLGFREGEGFQPRVKHALLLSATPYDRDLTQLHNQLKLVGRLNLLPEEIDSGDKEQVQTHLRRFMVRRLNAILINGEKRTRNMYRKEWRKGSNAEITLETDEQKLVTALVQKKVSEMLVTQSRSPSFQAGLLASFESFQESTRSPPVEFDGERAEKKQTDARDRRVIGRIADSYKNYSLGRSLPHPKMDTVVKRLANAMFNGARKQLVFVRRVKSVNEIKNKLDDAYNEWIRQYISQVLSSDAVPCKMMESIYQSYLEVSGNRDASVIGGEFDLDDKNSDESPPPKNDTFFAWFFRGAVPEEASSQLSVDGRDYPSPDLVRRGLAARKRVLITLFEPNWSWFVCRQEGFDLGEILNIHGEDIALTVGRYFSEDLDDDNLEVYHACQTAFIKWLIDHNECTHLEPLYRHMAVARLNQSVQTVNKENLISQLMTVTLYSELEVSGLAQAVIPHQKKLYNALKTGNRKVPELLKLFDIHKTLMSFVLRTAHSIIDVYLARLKQGPGNLTVESRAQWINDFVSILLFQRNQTQFSTFHELVNLAEHLELIIKNNIPDIRVKKKAEYPKYLSDSLSPVSPVIGASGETPGRSSQARKFRMPGYPLALVSTDVFQEGEDLHTFCDSVVHYGLSGLPVSLEQKVGRVDRVSSCAERRLMALDREAEEEELIQVAFPYVKESIEVLQIRQVCKNYNEFIESLHEVISNVVSAKDIVQLETELASKEDVPEQILDRLKSPFDPNVEEWNEYNAIDSIENNERSRNSEIRHVCELLNRILGCKAPEEPQSYHHEDGVKVRDSNLEVKLVSAKASNKLLLSLTRPSDPSIVQISDRKTLVNLMREFSWHTFHRTYAIEDSNLKEGYQLYFNAEMLVSDAETTQHTDIKRIFERMEINHDPANYQKSLSSEISAHVSLINMGKEIPFDRSGDTGLQIGNANGVTNLMFEFGGLQNHRAQHVSLYESDGRCIFLSKASSEGFGKRLPVSDVIKHTWIRNRYIDLVEFVLNPDWAIVGRVVHPIDDMRWEEFIYCAYTLAVETDRLEYLLNPIDVH